MICRTIGRSPCRDVRGPVGSDRVGTRSTRGNSGAIRPGARLRIWLRKEYGFDSRLSHKAGPSNALAVARARESAAPQMADVVKSVVVGDQE